MSRFTFVIILLTLNACGFAPGPQKPLNLGTAYSIEAVAENSASACVDYVQAKLVYDGVENMEQNAVKVDVAGREDVCNLAFKVDAFGQGSVTVDCSRGCTQSLGIVSVTVTQ